MPVTMHSGLAAPESHPQKKLPSRLGRDGRTGRIGTALVMGTGNRAGLAENTTHSLNGKLNLPQEFFPHMTHLGHFVPLQKKNGSPL